MRSSSSLLVSVNLCPFWKSVFLSLRYINSTFLLKHPHVLMRVESHGLFVIEAYYGHPKCSHWGFAKESAHCMREILLFRGMTRMTKDHGEESCCDAWMAKRTHWWIERWSRLWVSVSLSLSLSLSVSRSVSPSLSIYLSIDRSNLSIYLSINLPVYLSIDLSINQSTCLSIYLSIYQSINLPVYLSIDLSIDRSIYRIYPSIYLSNKQTNKQTN